MIANDNCIIGSRSRARMSSPFLPRAVNARASAQGRDRLRRYLILLALALVVAAGNYLGIEAGRASIRIVEGGR